MRRLLKMPPALGTGVLRHGGALERDRAQLLALNHDGGAEPAMLILLGPDQVLQQVVGFRSMPRVGLPRDGIVLAVEDRRFKPRDRAETVLNFLKRVDVEKIDQRQRRRSRLVRVASV